MEISGRDSKEQDRQTGEKALDLPALSRLGEGRAEGWGEQEILVDFPAQF